MNVLVTLKTQKHGLVMILRDVTLFMAIVCRLQISMATVTWIFLLQKWRSGQNQDPMPIILMPKHLFFMVTEKEILPKRPFRKKWIFMKRGSPTWMAMATWMFSANLITG